MVTHKDKRRSQEHSEPKKPLGRCFIAEYETQEGGRSRPNLEGVEILLASYCTALGGVSSHHQNCRLTK